MKNAAGAAADLQCSSEAHKVRVAMIDLSGTRSFEHDVLDSDRVSALTLGQSRGQEWTGLRVQH